MRHHGICWRISEFPILLPLSSIVVKALQPDGAHLATPWKERLHRQDPKAPKPLATS